MHGKNGIITHKFNIRPPQKKIRNGLSWSCAMCGASNASGASSAGGSHWKRLVPSRSHELHESKFPFVSRIKFILPSNMSVVVRRDVYGSKLFFFSAHVSGVRVSTNRGQRLHLYRSCCGERRWQTEHDIAICCCR